MLIAWYLLECCYLLAPADLFSYKWFARYLRPRLKVCGADRGILEQVILPFKNGLIRQTHAIFDFRLADQKPRKIQLVEDPAVDCSIDA